MSEISLSNLLCLRIEDAPRYRHNREDPASFDESVHAKILDEGGCTISTNGTVPVTGYALSEHKEHEEIIPIADFTSQHVENFRTEHEELLARPNSYIGGWFNEDNDTVYLDISTVLPERREAMARARGARQAAIWDLGKLEEIRVEKDSLRLLKNNRSTFQKPRITHSRRSKRTPFPFEREASKPARRSVKRRSAVMSGAKSISAWTTPGGISNRAARPSITKKNA